MLRVLLVIHRVRLPASIYLDVEADDDAEALVQARALCAELCLYDGGDLTVDGHEVRVYADDQGEVEVVEVVDDDDADSPMHPVLDDDYDSDIID